MPWETPTLAQVRGLVRDAVHGSLVGSDATIPNSVLRVMSDNQGATCFLTLEYLDWLALQLMPDTAEHEWLDRHGNIWLVNADGTTGRKMATLAAGSATLTGTNGAVIPLATQLIQGVTNFGGTISYETMQEVTIGTAPISVPIRAIDPGLAGNMNPGDPLSLVDAPLGVDQAATVEELDGGTDQETDDELRFRVLERIRQPPMGGSQHDYVQWALAVPGVTRAWCAPNEMGIGTITVRFLMDDLRADDDGWPRQVDIDKVTAYIDKVRSVATKDRFVLAPIKQFIDFHIANLNPNTDEVKAEIEASIQSMLLLNAAPGVTIYAAWKSFAIMSAANVLSFQLTNTDDDVMLSPGHMAVLGDIFYDQ